MKMVEEENGDIGIGEWNVDSDIVLYLGPPGPDDPELPEPATL